MVTQEDLDKVRDIFVETLNERFAGELVFDPIVVKPAVDYIYGDEYLHILVVFDGDQKRLDPDWTLSLIPRMMLRLEEEGINYFPSTSYISKSEWKYLTQRGKFDII